MNIKCHLRWDKHYTDFLIKQNVLSKQKVLYKPCAVDESGAGAASVTPNLYLHDVNCSQHAFSLIDTSETNRSSQTNKHPLLLRTALTIIKMNTIFIVIKYQCRFDTILENSSEVERPVFKSNHEKL
jgi:hypothetical protein